MSRSRTQFHVVVEIDPGAYTAGARAVPPAGPRETNDATHAADPFREQRKTRIFGSRLFVVIFDARIFPRAN